MIAEYYSNIKKKYKRPEEIPEIYNEKICKDIKLLIKDYPIEKMDKYLRRKRPYGYYDIIYKNNDIPEIKGKIEIHDGIITELKLVDIIEDNGWMSAGFITVKNKAVRFGKEKKDNNTTQPEKG